ncbi:MAG: DUF1273 domain-containing protein [Oscillospiraceae bacterium]|nr:DUF1273 domain-containing protein [Oscillospiraceae bacterium]
MKEKEPIIYSYNPTIITDRATTACFAGHRPEKIPFHDDELKMRMLMSMFIQRIYDAIDDGYRTFITGMARGVDIWGGRAIFALKHSRPELNLKMIGISPYRKELDKLHNVDIYEYGTVRQGCDEMYYLSEDYFQACYHIRNRLMVDHSSRVIGVISDYKSGTGNTLKEASRQGLKLDVIDINGCDFFNF